MVFVLIVVVGDSSGGTGDELALGWISAGSGYRKSIVECLAKDEFELRTEATHCILTHCNSIPCSRHGASYYNCRLDDWANPYSRSCSAITPFPSLEIRYLD
ncbi:Rapid ALkalinization Factor (RALF) [Musa troglodytarum]|uniref:Rapid ALkalinization Factor (RALF) n=1 Tax=Musa troglodytarum TaxID=320322 RepID=A0A9E7G1I3_9LILI|nr:Rapid ALkalinization Factor (RALF) [Musa troglodytarum]